MLIVFERLNFYFLFFFFKQKLGENFQEEYSKLNPFKKVPVIDDNGFILTERYAMEFR